MAGFVDRVTVHAAGGSGGDGCASVRRMKYKPLGGPDGGDGGRGGSVILEVDPQTTTLLAFHYGPHVRATSGQPGIGGFGHGKNGEDVVLPVPLGTVVKGPDGALLADLASAGERFVVARGGAGGLGNAALATRARKAPGFALLGEPGGARDVVLELKSVADVALVGFPSSGKSSLIAALSAARPKIADYPFTTLVPNLGVVQAGDSRYTIADVPGLVRGASRGRGLGLDFLRHIERCAVVVHVVDAAAPEPDRDPVSDLRAIEAELAAYQEDLTTLEGYVPLARRPRVIALNKVDLPEGRDLAELVRPDLEAFGWPIVEVSAVTHAGLRELSFTLARLVERERARRPAPRPRPVLHPRPVGAASRVSVTRRESEGGVVYQVRGEKPERWVAQTDFGNDEAVGYLADRLAAAGVEDRLREAGARPGDAVVIGDLQGGAVFDWEPAEAAGAELLGARGTDLRLDAGRRPTRDERRAAHHRRMDAKAEARRGLARERESGHWTDPQRGA